MVPEDNHPDFQEHIRTYSGFTRVLMWSVLGVVTVLTGMVIWLL